MRQSFPTLEEAIKSFYKDRKSPSAKFTLNNGSVVRGTMVFCGSKEVAVGILPEGTQFVQFDEIETAELLWIEVKPGPTAFKYTHKIAKNSGDWVMDENKIQLT